MKKTRIHYLDMAKAVAACAVITCHNTYAPEGLRSSACTLCVSMFFIISGMLDALSHKEKKSLAVTASDRAVRLFVPYAFFSFFYALILIRMNYVNNAPAGIFTGMDEFILKTLSLNGASVLWFIPAFFFSEMLLILLLKFADRISNGKGRAVYVTSAFVIIALLGLLSFFSLELRKSHEFFAGKDFMMYLAGTLVRIPFCTFLTAIGYFVTELWKAAAKKTEKKLIKMGPSATDKLTLIIDAALGLILIAAHWVVDHLTPTCDVRTLTLQDPLISLASMLLGTFGFILILKSLEPLAERFPLNIPGFYGRHSLEVMLTHMDLYPLYIAEVISLKLIQFVPFYQVYILTFMILIGVLIIDIPYLFILDKICPFIMGRKYNRKSQEHSHTDSLA